MGPCIEGQAETFRIKTFDPVKTKICLTAVVCGLVIHLNGYSQWKAGIEQYFYTHAPLAEPIVPMIHVESANNFYAELRYNYEEAKTISFFAGKSFAGGNNLAYNITPMAGYSTGRFAGLSFAVNANAEWKRIFLSSQTQYSWSLARADSITGKSRAGSFFFSWSEAGYTFGENFFAGLSAQFTRQAGVTSIEPGKSVFPVVCFQSF